MKDLFDGIVENHMDSDKILIQVYANYLMNGGNPDTFDRLTDDDIQMMHTVFVAQEARRQKGIAEMLRGSFGLGGN